MTRERYTLTLEALPRSIPATQRLRAMLKFMLRGYGLRCLRIEPVDGAAEKPPDELPDVAATRTPPSGHHRDHD